MHTVVSACPFGINEFRPGVIPDRYLIEPADPKNGIIKVLAVDDANRLRYIRDGESVHLPVSSEELARSIVNDLIVSIPGFDPVTDSKPALFFVEGAKSVTDIKEDYKPELSKALESQVRWFKILVRQAEDEWSAYHQHRMISDQQRYAAAYLGLEREWAKEDNAILTKCPACMTLIEEAALVCRACSTIIKLKEYEARFKRVQP